MSGAFTVEAFEASDPHWPNYAMLKAYTAAIAASTATFSTEHARRFEALYYSRLHPKLLLVHAAAQTLRPTAEHWAKSTIQLAKMANDLMRPMVMAFASKGVSGKASGAKGASSGISGVGMIKGAMMMLTKRGGSGAGSKAGALEEEEDGGFDPMPIFVTTAPRLCSACPDPHVVPH
jgi:hypothetical protein